MGEQYTISREQFMEVLRFYHYSKPCEDLINSKNAHAVISASLVCISIIVFFFTSTAILSIILFSISLFSALTAIYKYYRFILLMQEWREWEKSCKEIELSLPKLYV